ncbi:MAG: putative NAD(P)/FAD-binding protein YdhS [Chlamydiales bacterium]|jgi:uncharacterized NAD(P)/FAD-binding protein YdhS
MSSAIVQKDFDVAIVGGGCSGTLVALQLLKQTNRSVRVALIERSDTFGKGVAYNTSCVHHLLNVPAERMSAFPSEPAHFIDWLQANAHRFPNYLDAPVTGKTFVPRMLYGEYLKSSMDLISSQAKFNGSTIEIIRDEVENIAPGLGTSGVALKSGRTLRVGSIVLALGNYPKEKPFGSIPCPYENKNLILNPWNFEELDTIGPNEKVLIIGSGLTMVDVVLYLKGNGHRGSIQVLSRRGFLPKTHDLSSEESVGEWKWEKRRNLLLTVKTFRSRVREHMKRGGNWRSVVDSVRPYMQSLWKSFEPYEKKQFVRHVRPFWDIHRHRVAPKIGGAISSLIENIELRIVSGRLRKITRCREGIEVVYHDPKKQRVRTVSLDKVINCTGPQEDLEKLSNPFIQYLFQQGLVQKGPLDLGIMATSSGEVINAEGDSSENLYVLGSMLKGVLWESIAVPELREQAEVISKRVLAKHEKMGVGV